MPKPVVKAGTRPPWVGLAAAVWVQVSAGSGSTFPLYSAALKSVLGFNQQQLTMLGVANDIGENVGLVPGYASNKLPPWCILLVGVIACFLGFGVLWLAVSQTVKGLPFWVLWIALVVGTNSNAWFNTAVIVTNMRNFPLSRGTVSGVLKGYVGISTAVYTVLYNLVLQQSPSYLLLFLTVGLPILCLAVIHFIRPCTPASGADSLEHSHFIFVQIASAVLAIYLVTCTVMSQLVSLDTVVSYILVAVMVIILLSPLAIPVKMTLFPMKDKKSSSNNLSLEEDNSSTQSEPLLRPSSSASHIGSFFENEDSTDMESLIAEGEGAVKKKRKPRRGEDFKLGEAFLKADFWLLWFAYFLGAGSGVTFTNNLAQIGVAFGVNHTAILLCLYSFFNFLGRLGSGLISEHFVKSHTIPRSLWMGVAQMFMVLSFLLYAVALKGTLYIGTALLGFCIGFQYVAVPTVSELFGLKHFGINYNFILLGNPVGALIFSSGIAGYLYDKEAAKQGTSICSGPDCFRLTFLVLAGVCGLGTLICIILTVRIRPVYQALYASGSFSVRH